MKTRFFIFLAILNLAVGCKKEEEMPEITLEDIEVYQGVNIVSGSSNPNSNSPHTYQGWVVIHIPNKNLHGFFGKVKVTFKVQYNNLSVCLYEYQVDEMDVGFLDAFQYTREYDTCDDFFTFDVEDIELL